MIRKLRRNQLSWPNKLLLLSRKLRLRMQQIRLWKMLQLVLISFKRLQKRIQNQSHQHSRKSLRLTTIRLWQVWQRPSKTRLRNQATIKKLRRNQLSYQNKLLQLSKKLRLRMQQIRLWKMLQLVLISFKRLQKRIQNQKNQANQKSLRLTMIRPWQVWQRLFKTRLRNQAMIKKLRRNQSSYQNKPSQRSKQPKLRMQQIRFWKMLQLVLICFNRLRKRIRNQKNQANQKSLKLTAIRRLQNWLQQSRKKLLNLSMMQLHRKNWLNLESKPLLPSEMPRHRMQQTKPCKQL